MSEWFYIANLLEVGRKKASFFDFSDFDHLQTKVN